MAFCQFSKLGAHSRRFSCFRLLIGLALRALKSSSGDEDWHLPSHRHLTLDG